MKTAVSIPDPVFKSVERLARRTKQSRSAIYSRALSEFVARHSGDEVTETMNAALEDIGGSPDLFVSRAARRVLASTEW